MSSSGYPWQGHSGYGGYGGGNYSAPKQTIYGYYAITLDDGTVILDDITNAMEYEALLLSNLVKIEHDGDVEAVDLKKIPADLTHDFIIVHCNENDISWTKKTRYVHKCLVKAADEHLSHWFGRKLDNDDDTWYSSYADKVTTDGCTEKWTLTVTHQLVAPYEVGIKKVFVPRNANLSPEMYVWMGRLGTNPDYAKDYSTTNEEYFAKLGCDQATINKIKDAKERASMQDMHDQMEAMFGFQCSDRAPGPAIVLSSFSASGNKTWSSTSGYSSGGGSYGTTNTHSGGAFYEGPRSNGKSTWKIAVQLGWLKDLAYDEFKFPLDPYRIDPGIMTPKSDTLKIVKQDGKSFDVWQVKSWLQKKKTAAAAAHTKAATEARKPFLQAVRRLALEFDIGAKEAKAVLDSFKGNEYQARQFLESGDLTQLPRSTAVAPTRVATGSQIPQSSMGFFGSDMCPDCFQKMTPYTRDGNYCCDECNAVLGPVQSNLPTVFPPAGFKKSL